MYFERDKMYFQLFQGVNQYWYWRFYIANDEKVAFSSEGYSRKEQALASIDKVRRFAAQATIEELNV